MRTSHAPETHNPSGGFEPMGWRIRSMRCVGPPRSFKLMRMAAERRGLFLTLQKSELLRAANEPKTFVKIPGADHNNWLTENYLTRLDEFISRLASERNQTSN
jgi:hypothetical protein